MRPRASGEGACRRARGGEVGEPSRTGSTEVGPVLAAEGERVKDYDDTSRKEASLEMRSAREAPALCGLPLTDRDAASSCGLFGLATVVAFAVVTMVAGFLVFEGGRSARFGALGPLPRTFEPFPPLGGYLASEDFDQRDPTATRTTLRSEDRFPGGSPEGIHRIRTLQGLDSGAMLEERPRAARTARSERGSRIRRRAVAFDAGSDLEAWGGERDGGVVAKELPSVEESTIMFLHVYKCAGSTLRRMLVDWAEADGQRGAIVHKCDHTSEVTINFML